MLVMDAHAPAHSLAEYLQVGRQYEEMLGEVRAIPGVTSAAAVMGLPTGHYGSNGSFAGEGRHVFGKSRDMPQAGFRLASPGYFGGLRGPAERGRGFPTQ